MCDFIRENKELKEINRQFYKKKRKEREESLYLNANISLFILV